MPGRRAHNIVVDRYQYFSKMVCRPHASGRELSDLAIPQGRYGKRVLCQMAQATLHHDLTTESSRHSILIVDGTNILSRSYGAIKGYSERIGSLKARDVFALWMDYLASCVSASLVICVFDHPDNIGLGVGEYKGRKKRAKSLSKKNKRGGSLWEYQEYFAGKGDHWHMALSLPGEEADRYIMRCVRQITGLHSGGDTSQEMHVYVASGDSDMQAILDTLVSWVEILPFLTRQCPSGIVVHSLKDFKWNGYFHPSQYGTFLSLTGKAGAVGISETTAAKLIHSFGSIDAMYDAFDAGQMKGWDNRVQMLFHRSQQSPQYRRLERNRQIFEFDTHGEEGPTELEWIASTATAAVHTTPSEAIHPFFSIHWHSLRDYPRKCLQPLETRCLVSWKPCIAEGFFADASIQICPEATRLYILFVEAESKILREGHSYADIAYMILNGNPIGLEDPFAVFKKAEPGMARYLRLLKASGQNLLLLPYSS